MKPAFKTTAVAILVALGVTACKSNDSSNPAPQPTPVNNQANTGNTQANNATQDAEQARLEAEKKAQEAEQARLDAEKKAKEATDLKAKEEAEKARLEAEKKAQEAEQARLEAEKKAKEAADLKAKQEAEEKARLEAEKKAKEVADLKAKQEAEEKARLEAEKKAKEAEQARLEAEKKAKEAADLKAKQEAEKVANEWRGSASNANIVDPETRNSYSKTVYPELPYVDGYDGTQDNAPIRDWTNSGYKLDYYQLSVNDKNNPQLLGWHKGEIKSAGINGSQISKINETGEITERTYPEKVDYYFKNTPYSTYGAVYNNYEANLFANFEKASSISTNDNTYQIGEYEVVDGNKTTKIKYNDSVKGSATYKGEVLAVASRRTSNEYGARTQTDKTPTVDGTIAIVANFGPRAEENFASATLDSKVLGKVEFPKTRMKLNNSGIEYDTSSISENINKYDPVNLQSTVVGKDASEIVGKINVRDTYTSKVGEVKEYNAVFAAEKQPK